MSREDSGVLWIAKPCQHWPIQERLGEQAPRLGRRIPTGALLRHDTGLLRALLAVSLLDAVQCSAETGLRTVQRWVTRFLM